MYKCGTKAYCPPEILANFHGEGRLVDRTKHDVFSLGVIIFEARPPFAEPFSLHAPRPACTPALALAALPSPALLAATRLETEDMLHLRPQGELVTVCL